MFTSLFAAIDLTPLMPVIVALVGGDVVAWYTGRAKKDSIIIESSERALTVVNRAIEHFEGELAEARTRMAVLEERLAHAKAGAQEDRD